MLRNLTRLLIFFLFLNSFLSFGQLDSLWGKYKLAEPNGENYEAFVLLPENKAVLLKVYSKKFLFANELPKDSLTLIFNPGLDQVSEFPIEFSLAQAISAKWKYKEDTLYLIDNNLHVSFRKFKTSYAVAESQIAGFTNSETPLYYQSERWNQFNEPITKLNVLTSGNSQIPGNFDLYEYRTKTPKYVIIESVDGTYRDSLYFKNGKGKHVVKIKDKSLKRKNNLFSNFELNRKRVAGYFYNQVHGYEYTYYAPEEITEIYEGKKFLLKREAWYEQGVEHGKWLYYDKKGHLVKTEIWKKGELKKTIEP